MEPTDYYPIVGDFLLKRDVNCGNSKRALTSVEKVRADDTVINPYRGAVPRTVMGWSLYLQQKTYYRGDKLGLRI